MDTAERLTATMKEVLAAHHSAQVIIGRDALTFLGSSGLRALLTARRVAGEHAAALKTETLTRRYCRYCT
jgi:anti-anti-sigma regulatory factor